MSSLKDILVDICAASTQPVSVFKQSFERAERGIAKPSPSASVSVSTPSLEF